MAESLPQFLRLFSERPAGLPEPDALQLPSLGELCGAFERATGWSLRYVSGPAPRDVHELTWSAPVTPGVGASLGHLRIEAASGPGPAADLRDARELAVEVAGVLARLVRTEHVLWQREAELAVGVPLFEDHREPEHLAQRLEAVLRSACDAIGCTAAAVYLLDETTSHLNLRAIWRLPRERFAAPARELSDATADLEALCGHAIVLDDVRRFPTLPSPEDFPAAVCVPISTATVPLGTLWLFAESPREFNDEQVNLVELTAGRLASDLEREVLMREVGPARRMKQHVEAAERLQESSTPHAAPVLDGWDVAGWTSQAHLVGGDFHDWFTAHDGRTIAAVGDCLDGGLDAALTASAVRAALRAHGRHALELGWLLEQVNRTLWETSGGEQYASLFCAELEAGTGRVLYSGAGQIEALWQRTGHTHWLSRPTLALGRQPDGNYATAECEMAVGDVLVLATDGVLEATDDEGRAFGRTGVELAIAEAGDASAETLAAILRDRLEAHATGAKRDDRSVLVLRRGKPTR